MGYVQNKQLVCTVEWIQETHEEHDYYYAADALSVEKHGWPKFVRITWPEHCPNHLLGSDAYYERMDAQTDVEALAEYPCEHRDMMGFVACHEDYLEAIEIADDKEKEKLIEIADVVFCEQCKKYIDNAEYDEDENMCCDCYAKEEEGKVKSND